VRNCHDDDDDEIVVARVSVIDIAINTVVVVDKGMRGFIVVLSWSFVCCVLLLLHRLIQNKHTPGYAGFPQTLSNRCPRNYVTNNFGAVVNKVPVHLLSIR
jgi:hypothetical protein